MQLIGNCHDVLRQDARRRFTLGVTVVHNEMRVWFFSRTHHMVSESFNFATEPEILIRVLLSIAFASPEQLGYDTTMSYFIDDAGAAQYRISLSKATYITTKLLSDNRSDVICGRATRVWEAYREDDPDRVSVAIKDLWMSADIVQEGTQLLELHEKLHALPDPGTPRPPGDYFLTVLAHGFVPTSRGVDDDTFDVMMRGHSFPIEDADYGHRKHYRIIFQEVGVPVDSLTTLSDIMHALADATRGISTSPVSTLLLFTLSPALLLLHRLHLVHRDVSAGNIMLFNGVGKLSDLEYLKSFQGPLSATGDGYIVPLSLLYFLAIY
ncbi:hypothetical protein B0H10DRAFT_2051084 [Mycena sp. CBHHK59/15]|nr:hypothetical protein B0H10DRAFT_2051084 [Mycena sp. CBHHK59/15]